MKSSKHECGPSIAAVELTQVESWSAYLPRDSTRALSRTNWIYRFHLFFGFLFTALIPTYTKPHVARGIHKSAVK